MTDILCIGIFRATVKVQVTMYMKSIMKLCGALSHYHITELLFQIMTNPEIGEKSRYIMPVSPDYKRFNTLYTTNWTNEL